MKTQFLFFALMITLILGCISCKNTKNVSGGVDSVPPTVEVTFPEVDSIVLNKTFPGYLKADKSIEIVARVNGYLVGKYFNDGGYVKKGQKLFSIEDTQYRQQLNQAQAQLQSAIAANDYATKHYNAMKKALESSAVSQMDVIQAETAMKESEASIENARAAVKTAETILGYCTVTAPISGRIAAPTYSVGEYLSGGSAPVTLTTIFDDRVVKAGISIEDGLYLDIIANMKNNAVDYSHIPVTFNDTPSNEYIGSLCYVAPNIDHTTGSLDLQVEINNPNGELKAGMYALVYLPFETEPHAILVKDASIGTDQQGNYIYTIGEDNRVIYTPVVVGKLANDSMRIVKKGISPDTRYVTKALLKVRDGVEINPVVVK